MNLNTNIIDFIVDKSKSEFDPFYIYDSQIIKDQCLQFETIAYHPKSIHFASMANVNPDFLKIIMDEGLNIFVNSILHLELALSLGFRPENIVFTASALSDRSFQIAGETGVQVNLDSTSQLDKWSNLFPNKRCGIRCNIGDRVKPYSTHAGYFIGSKSRLGFTLEEIESIKDKDYINGLHLYIGTDIFDLNYFISCYEELTQLTKLFPNLDYLNFGGGFGLAENGEAQFDFQSYNQQVTLLMQESSLEYGKELKLILEPGRIIGGASGYFVTHVTDVKKRKEQLLVGVNASTAQFSRPMLYPEIAHHPIKILRNGREIKSSNLVETTVFGCSTYSRDLFVRNRLLQEIEIGDILILGNAGSYAASSYMEFLGFPKPKEYFV